MNAFKQYIHTSTCTFTCQKYFTNWNLHICTHKPTLVNKLCVTFSGSMTVYHTIEQAMLLIESICRLAYIQRDEHTLTYQVSKEKQNSGYLLCRSKILQDLVSSDRPSFCQKMIPRSSNLVGLLRLCGFFLKHGHSLIFTS